MIAHGLVDAGAKVYITGRNPSMCAEVAKELCSVAGGVVIAICADLSSEEGTIKLASELSSKEHAIDFLINNAGSHIATSLADGKYNDFIDMISVNVAAPFILTQRLLHLLEVNASIKNPSRIINIGSNMVNTNKSLDSYAYSCSKQALEKLSVTLAHELATKYITVNCLALGAFPTRLCEPFFPGGKLIESLSAANPMGRPGQKDDIVGAITYLCSKAGSHVTGSIIPIDGGTV